MPKCSFKGCDRNAPYPVETRRGILFFCWEHIVVGIAGRDDVRRSEDEEDSSEH